MLFIRVSLAGRLVGGWILVVVSLAWVRLCLVLGMIILPHIVCIKYGVLWCCFVVRKRYLNYNDTIVWWFMFGVSCLCCA